MDVRYLVSLPSGDRTGDLRLVSARRKVRGQAKKYGADRSRRMRLRVRGRDDDFGPWRKDLGETMEAWDRLVAASKPSGDVVVVDYEDYPYSTATRPIDVTPPTVQTEGNSDIDRIWTWLVRNEKGRSGGICNRRNIAGSSSWSQHSPWKAPDPGSNAVDWFSYPDSMDELYDQAYRLAAAAKANPAEVPVGLILVGSKKWTPSGWSSSGAAYHRHLHIQGRKTRTGSPASSC